MKSLKNYITESFKINKNTKLQKYNYFLIYATLSHFFIIFVASSND
jgi:hypothetical protein